MRPHVHVQSKMFLRIRPGTVRYGADADCGYYMHIGAIWRIRLNRLCAAAMRPYVKYFDYLILLLLGRIVVLCRPTYTQPIDTDGVASSVCLSVRPSVTIVSPAKTTEPIGMPFCCGLE